MRSTAALGLSVVALLLGGCGSATPAAAPASPASPASPVSSVVAPPTPLPCGAAMGLALPAGWPSGVPLPPDHVVTRTERRSGDRLIISARVPGDFHGVVRFFNGAMPKAGFRQFNGQLDPFDSESDFSGTTVQGRWTVGLSPECEGQSNLTVLALPVGAPPPVATPLPTPSSP